jgi:hypothetical protein
MKVNINITNLDEFKEQSKAVELAAEKLQKEVDKLNAMSIFISDQKIVTLEGSLIHHSIERKPH